MNEKQDVKTVNDLNYDSSDPTRSLSTSLEFIWDMPGQRDYDGEYIEKKYLVIAYDFGLPYSTLRNLTKLGCDIRIVPVDCSPEEVIALRPEGILLGGGPGIPDKMKYAINNIARLVGLRPILATGLGHILLALSMGARLELLEKPHFGNEIYVKSVMNSNILQPHSNSIPLYSEKNRFRTNQTHLVSLDRKSLEQAGFRVSFVNTTDSAVEGYENEEFLIHSYAFSLGGNDSFTLSCIKRFISCMEEHRAGKRLI